MNFIALVSGGKDSVYSIECCIRSGHKLVGLLYMENKSPYADSYMYQTVGSEVVRLFGECLDVPLFVYSTSCEARNKELQYTEEVKDEVEDLYNALKEIQHTIFFEGVSSGAILSRYQKNRVENVCNRLGLVSLAPLWNKNQKELLKEMVDYGMEAILVKVASSSLNKSFLTKHISKVYESDVLLDDNYCGEGGEYESIVLDCPLFRKRLVYNDFEIKHHPDEQMETATVFFVELKGLQSIKK